MNIIRLALSIALLFPGVVSMAHAQQLVGSASILAPAVILSNNTGTLTTVNLAVSRGNGNVSVNGPAIVGQSTVQSAQIAAAYAAQYLKMNFSNYNFSYTIVDSGSNVSGPSAGGAFTILAVSALSGRHLLKNFTMTGTISPDGSIGPIGGVYDKVSAAKARGLAFVLVPAVSPGSEEDRLYTLVQDTFNIPVVEVANVSQAALFVFGGGNIKANITTYQVYKDYNVGNMPPAPLSCSNSCNMAPFARLVNTTFNFTASAIATLASKSNFSSLSPQFTMALAQERQMAGKGYLYTGADMAYLNYIDIYNFNNYLITKQNGYTTLTGVNNECASLNAPQLTSSNYEYVIGGELRQLWGQYTTNATLSIYNITGSIATTDDVLSAMAEAAQASGWCIAASQLYGISGSAQGQNVVPSQNLSIIASSRVARAQAAAPGTIYTVTAQAALASKNYPVAIVDADYGYALNFGPHTPQNMTTAQMLSAASGVDRNSTYGAWATQFADESEFYIWQAQNANNATASHSYAQTAFMTALLASQISNDTMVISQNLQPGTASQPRITLPTTSTIAQNQQNATAQQAPLSATQQLLQDVDLLLVLILAINLITLVVMVKLVSTLSKMLKMQYPSGIKPAGKPARNTRGKRK